MCPTVRAGAHAPGRGIRKRQTNLCKKISENSTTGGKLMMTPPKKEWKTQTLAREEGKEAAVGSLRSQYKIGYVCSLDKARETKCNQQTSLPTPPRFLSGPTFSCTTLGRQSEFWFRKFLFRKKDIFLSKETYFGTEDHPTRCDPFLDF